MSRWLIVLALGIGISSAIAWILTSAAHRPRETSATALVSNDASEAPGDPEDAPEQRATAEEGAVIIQRDAVALSSSAPTPANRVRAASNDDLIVRLVDASTGSPVRETELSLIWNSGEGNGRGVRLIARGRVEGERAELRVPRSKFQRIPAKSFASGALHIHAAWLGTSRVEKKVALEPWPAQPIELALPATGYVRLRSAFPQRQHFLLDVATPSATTPQRVTIADGSSKLFACMLGAELKISGELLDGTPAALLSAAGPVQAGEIRELAIVRSPGACVLAVQAVNERGEALAQREYRVQRDPSGASSDTALHLYSDSQGWIRCGRSETPSAGELLVTLERSGAPIQRGRIAYPADLEAGEHELGTLVLLEDRLLASGRVVDREQRPISMAEVVPLPGPSGEFTGQPRRARTDRFGRFEIRAEQHASSFALRVDAPGYASGMLSEVLPGSIDLVFVLEEGARCEGSVSLPPGFDAESVEIRATLMRIAPASSSPEYRSERLGYENRFSISKLPAGRLDLEFWSSETGKLAHIEGIAIESGTVNRDPRLQGLSLAVDWQPQRLRVVDAADWDHSHSQLVLEAEDSSSHTRVSRPGSLNRRSRISMWFPPTTRSVRVLAWGKLEVVVAPSPEEQEVVLQRGWRVLLPVELSADSPANGCSVWLESESGARSRYAFLRSGELEFHVPRADRYRLQTSYLEERTENDHGLRRRALSNASFDITHDGQRLPILVHPELQKR